MIQVELIRRRHVHSGDCLKSSYAQERAQSQRWSRYHSSPDVTHLERFWFISPKPELISHLVLIIFLMNTLTILESIKIPSRVWYRDFSKEDGPVSLCMGKPEVAKHLPWWATPSRAEEFLKVQKEQTWPRAVLPGCARLVIFFLNPTNNSPLDCTSSSMPKIPSIVTN